MGKITIVDLNPNDQEQLKAYMVKGEKGDAATIDVVKENGVATITINDDEGTKSFQLSDGEMTKEMVIDSLTSTITDQPLSANQGRVLKNSYDEMATDLVTLFTQKADATDVYDKTDADATFVKNNRIVKINGLLTIDDVGEEVIHLSYPTEFTNENCIVIGGKISVSIPNPLFEQTRSIFDTIIYFGTTNFYLYNYVDFTEDYLDYHIRTLSEFWNFATVEYEMYLMKVD